MRPLLSSIRERWSPALIITALLVIIILGYSLYRTRDLIRGPSLVLISPIFEKLPLNEPLITIAGQVARVAHLSLNDGKIFADNTGHFEDKLLLFPGYNIIKLEATDRFHRSVARFLELTYQPKR